ncbi:hypothetical protein [Pseudoalteromonas arabiensis]|uniref:hypothetical protein n=1 Tax=Pseudoalteromonas arabiensis TaxID=874454 RepID=UPI000784F8AB|nr:hypothetical protein [Pseudoalteromonas arabiensis]
MFGNFKIKVYNGSPAIIIDSYPRIREHLTETRYLASNPKLFTVGVGKLEAAKSMKGGFIVTLIVSVSFHALDLVLRDETTWHDFVAGVAVDMAVVAATIATTILVTKVLVGIVGTVVITTAAVPLVIVVVVGGVVTYLSSVFKKEIDEVTSLLSEQLRAIEEEIATGIIKIIPKNVIHEKNNCDNFYNYFYKITGIPRLGISKSKSKSNICKF